MKLTRYELAAIRKPRDETLSHAIADDRLQGRVRLIKEAMSLTGMMQKEIAAHIGVSKGQVSRWMQGTRPVPEKHVAKIQALIEEAA